MGQILISLDEVDRVRRNLNLLHVTDLADKTGLSRSTWTRALKHRRPTPEILQALIDLGARADQLLVVVPNAA